MKLNRKINEICILYITCIIVTAIIIGGLSSCAAPRSVRPTGNHSSVNRTPIRQEYKSPPEKNIEKAVKETSNEVDSNLPQASENNSNQLQQNEFQPTAIAGLSNNPEEKVLENELPSLVQQLRMLNAGQEDIQRGIHEIKTSINDIESRITKLENNKYPTKRDIAKVDKNLNKSNIILPDEAIKKPSPKKIPLKQRRVVDTKKEDIADREDVTNESNPKPADNKSNEDLKNEIDNIKAVVDRRDYGDAIKKLTKMIEEVKDPVTINVCNFYLGESHYGLKQYSKAIDYFEKVLRFGSSDKNDDALIGIAEAKFRLGNVSEAKEAYKKFMKSYPKSEHTPVARKMLQQI